MLAALAATTPESLATDAADGLRLWRRQLLRAQELGVARSDPVLLVRGLDVITNLLLRNSRVGTGRQAAEELGRGQLRNMRVPTKNSVQNTDESGATQEINNLEGGEREPEPGEEEEWVHCNASTCVAAQGAS